MAVTKIHKSMIEGSGEVGDIIITSGGVARAGTIKANGVLLSRTVYAALWEFARLSGNIVTEAVWSAGRTASYSEGDGSTNFRIPHLMGEFLRMVDEGRGLDANRVLGSAQASQNLSHAHGVNDPTHAHSIADPGHAHSVYDPGHSHSGMAASFGAYQGASRYGAEGDVGYGGIGASGTGISIYGAGTGIGIYGAATGISIQANGGSEARPRNVAVLPCIVF